MEEGRNQHSPSVNLPEATKETRDSIAAEHLVSKKTVKRAGKFADEVAKTPELPGGTTGA